MKNTSALLLILLSMSFASISFAEDEEATTSFQVTHENDLLAGDLVRNDDKFYTAGQSFSYIRETRTTKEAFTLLQTIYTPSAKKPDADPNILKNDRPYSGWLALEYRNSTFTSPTIKDTYGIQVGCTGRCSLAKEAQLAVHRAIGDNLPTWDSNYVQASEPGFILELERNYYPQNLVSEYADLSFYAAAKAGTIIDSGAIGADARLGYNIPRFPTEPIIFKLPRTDATAPKTAANPYTAYLFARLEERLVAFNSMLHGSMFQSERHRVTPEPFVSEGDVGLTLGYNVFRLTYRLTMFSSEWREKHGSFAFGGISLTF